MTFSIDPRMRQRILTTVIGLGGALFVGWLFGLQSTTAIAVFGGLAIAAILGAVFLSFPYQIGYTAIITSLFLYAFYPYARLRLGPLPLYLIDAMIGASIVGFFLARKPRNFRWSRANPVYALAIAYILFTILALFNEYLTTGRILEPVYILIRHLLSMATALLIPLYIDSRAKLRNLVWVLAIAMAMTALISTLQSLPNSPTRQLIPLLVPSASAAEGSQYYNKFLRDIDEAGRGQSLVGKANVTGAVITLLWPLALGLTASGNLGRRKHYLLIGMLLIGVLGVATTYSRSTYIGFGVILIVMTVSRLRPRGNIIGLVWMMVLIATVLGVIGQLSGLLAFEFIAGKFVDLLGGAESFDRGEVGRIVAYRDAAYFIVNTPRAFFIGDGLATQDLIQRGLIGDQLAIELILRRESSVLVSALYQRGLLAVGVLVALPLSMLWIMSRIFVYGEPRDPVNWLPWGVQGAICGMASFWLVEHIHTNNIAVQGLLFAVVGIVIAYSHLWPGFEPNPDLLIFDLHASEEKSAIE